MEDPEAKLLRIRDEVVQVVMESLLWLTYMHSFIKPSAFNILLYHFLEAIFIYKRQYSFTGLKMHHIYIPPVLGRALLPKYPRDLSQYALLRMTTFQSSCVLNLIKNSLLFYVQ